ncbi:hypothetical protein GOBAR_DD24394 [Gossypium barbadense]|nr:hypothetical protein GOBAR_DD24394 [Gossypium barbadense]
MAVNFVMQSSLVQPKPSLSLKTLQNPSLPQLSRLSPPSRVGFLLTKRSGVVGKLSTPSAVPYSAFSVLETVKQYRHGSFDCRLMKGDLGELGCSLKVCRNDELTVEELKRKTLGECSSPLVQNIIANSFGAWTIVPLLGVSTGMWCICEAFRGKTVRSPYGLKLGDSCCVYYYDEKEAGLFTGLPNPFQAGRGPDAFLDMDSFPLEALKVTAFTEDALIMAARHKIYKYLHGVHFSQESIITSEGKIIVQNFIKLIERKEAAESQN